MSRNRIIVLALSAVLCVLFCFPLVSCNSFLGFDDDGTTGIEIATMNGFAEDDGNPVVFGLLAIPAVLFVLAVIKKPAALLLAVSLIGLAAVAGFIITVFVRYEGDIIPTLFMWMQAVIYVVLIGVTLVMKKEQLE